MEARYMEHIKQHLFHPKTRRIAHSHYPPHLWIKNALLLHPLNQTSMIRCPKMRLENS